MINEFRPALLFVAKFLTVYFIGNIVYGVFIESYYPNADPITLEVSNHTASILNQMNFDITLENEQSAPKVIMKDHAIPILRIFEGCNGINVMIVFIAFLIAFGGPLRKMIWFAVGGLFVVHFFNLLRLSFLFNLAFDNSTSFYAYHKYFFTVTLYAIVFVLWVIWIFILNGKRSSKA